jgi:hypothetical protein
MLQHAFFQLSGFSFLAPDIEVWSHNEVINFKEDL